MKEYLRERNMDRYVENLRILGQVGLWSRAGSGESWAPKHI